LLCRFQKRRPEPLCDFLGKLSPQVPFSPRPREHLKVNIDFGRLTRWRLNFGWFGNSRIPTTNGFANDFQSFVDEGVRPKPTEETAAFTQPFKGSPRSIQVKSNFRHQPDRLCIRFPFPLPAVVTRDGIDQKLQTCSDYGCSKPPFNLGSNSLQPSRVSL